MTPSAMAQPEQCSSGTSGTEPVEGFAVLETGGEVRVTDTGRVISLDVKECKTVPPLVPQTSANVGHDAADLSTEGESGIAGDNCVLWSAQEYSSEGVAYSSYCLKYLVCGGERIDDVVSGRIAGEESTGTYRVYLDLVGESILDLIDAGQLEALGPTPSEVANRVGSISDVLLAKGLGEAPADDRIPVFYWCATEDTAGNRDPADTWTVSFGWDLTYGEVYDIPGARDDLHAQLIDALELYDPRIGLVPPAEGGHTFVQWPTWMFLENPPDDEHRYVTNSTDTLRIDLRATLLNIEWAFGDEQLASCAPDEMLQYNKDTHDPIDDLPPCHHIFTEYGRSDLTTTINFKIEQRIMTRPTGLLDPYPYAPWTDYLGTPTIIELTTTLPDYEIHPIASVVIRADQTTQDIITNARAAGTLPTLDD